MVEVLCNSSRRELRCLDLDFGVNKGEHTRATHAKQNSSSDANICWKHKDHMSF